MMPDPSPSDPARRVTPRDLALLVVYCLAYGGFMAVAAFRLDLLARPVVGGVNLAVAWGVGLIVLAIVLAVASLAGRKGTGA
jgi:uncharacterized membrane protein (DUF485 family)